MPDSDELLRFEMKELHEHIRSAFQNYIQWFTFFLTLLMAAMGWSLAASIGDKGLVVAPLPFFVMVALFSVQLIQSAMATTNLRQDIERAIRRIRKIQRTIDAQTAARPGTLATYSKVLRHTWLTLLFNFGLWLSIAIVVLLAMIFGWPLSAGKLT